MRLATWNINSVRLRISTIIEFVKRFNIDVLCLQETKTEDKYFPLEDFYKIGFENNYISGRKSYNGVAILSRLPIKKKIKLKWCGISDARHISVLLDNKITIHNFYVPAGGDIPDINLNDKFKHKIDFLKEMIVFFKNDITKKKIITGDLNVAPSEYDVWSHKQLINVVSHTPIETDLLHMLLKQGNLIDIIRQDSLPKEKLYSWWSYRSKDWKKSDKGRRLDHVFTSKDLKVIMTKICKEYRSLAKPSDHVPIIVDFN